jgi:siroheme synthase-like protein
MTAPLYPVGLLVQGRACLLVGGGRIATGKGRALIAAGARLTVIAPVVSEELATTAEHVALRSYESSDIAGFRLAVAATDDPTVNAQVFIDGEAGGVWVNSVDDPENCSFTLPAVHRRGPVTVAVATDGHSPALARWLRDRVAAQMPVNIEAVAATLLAERQAAHGRGVSTEDIDWSERITELLDES